MASLTKAAIRKMRTELQRDLDALQRVENILSRRNGASVSVRGARGGDAEAETVPTLPRPAPAAGETRTLKQICIDALKAVGGSGLRPRDLVQKCKDAGWLFNSDISANASVSTVLSRLRVDGKVEKNDESGKYFWIAD